MTKVKYKLILGLTATYERLDGREKEVLDLYCPVCDTITLEETKDIINQVDELLKKAFNDIHQGIFKINPKLAGTTINSCSYCTYSSICYKRVTDYIVIDKKGKEEENNENE